MKQSLFILTLFSSVLLIMIFSCQPQPTQEEQNLEVAVNTTTLLNTVNYDSATIQTARFTNFVNRLGQGNPIANYKIDSFAIPIKYFAYFDSLAQAGLLFQGADTSLWMMLTIDTLTTKPKKKIPQINVCFIAKDNTGSLRYFDMTTDTTLSIPKSLSPTVATARMNTYRAYLNTILSRVDTSAFCLVSLRGSQIPYTDLLEVYTQPKAATANNLYCVLVIKNCPQDAAKFTVDTYLNIFLQNESNTNLSVEAVAATKSTYFDFTQPCPSACAQ